ncbi:MAG: hypothetical protein KKF30_19275 [Proteobacteria bacterium]|nr:hypothetical protein [Pseudomonadota bacterium]
MDKIKKIVDKYCEMTSEWEWRGASPVTYIVLLIVSIVSSLSLVFAKGPIDPLVEILILLVAIASLIAGVTHHPQIRYELRRRGIKTIWDIER